MRFELLEARLLLYGNATTVALNATGSNVAAEPLVPTHLFDLSAESSDTQEFSWFSESLSRDDVDGLAAATVQWNSNLPVTGVYRFDDTESWFKSINSQSMTVADEGYLVAQRRATDQNSHTMLVAKKTNETSPSFLNDGLYLHPGHQYLISFDVRHPLSEASWLANHSWALIMQLWGPVDQGEDAVSPPFSIYTSSIDGIPYWNIRTRGDSKLITEAGEFETDLVSQVPVGQLGVWHHWDIEYVPDAFGKGLVRVWLDGTQVADWADVQNALYGTLDGSPLGPLNPSFGLYGPLAEDGMEAHFDNISIKSRGLFESSISGVASSPYGLAGNLITSVNLETGERFATTTGDFGVYSLAIPRGRYKVTALELTSGRQLQVPVVDASSKSTVLNLDFLDAPATALAADVDGDGESEVIVRDIEDGRWYVANPSDADETTGAVWGQWSNSTVWDDVFAGDFNGDGIDDLAGRAADGSWWVARSDGHRFYNEYWGTWSTAVDWLDVQPADVNGDGRIDIVGRASTDGSWWVARSDGRRFYNEHWGAWSTAVDWLDVHAADVDGDRKDDLVGRAKVDGTWWVARSDGARFEVEHWGTWSTAVDWLDVQPADVNGDGRIDLVGRASTDGSWWVAQNSEAHRQAFSNQRGTSSPIGHLAEFKVFSRALATNEFATPAEATPVTPPSGVGGGARGGGAGGGGAGGGGGTGGGGTGGGGGGDIPADAVRLNVGMSLGNMVSSYPAGTSFVIAAGVHMRQTIRPRAGMTFYGEPGAVLDGGDSTNYAFVGAADNVTIRDLEVRNYRPSDFMGAITAEDPGNQAHNGKNWVLKNLYVHHNWSSGVNMGDNTTIISSRFVENGLLGIGGRDFVGGLIEGNEIIGNNSRSAYSNSHGGGVKISTAAGLVIRNNIVADNLLTGLWCDGGCTNWTVEDNTVTDHYGRPGSGIMFEISSGATIRNNVVRGAGRPSPAWAWGAAILISTSSDVVVSGNVVSDANNGISVVYQDRSSSKNPKAHVDNITVVNNEFWDSGMSENTLTGVVTDTGVTLANLSLTWEDNRYRGNRAPKFWWQNGTKTLAEWKAMGFDADGTYER